MMCRALLTKTATTTMESWRKLPARGLGWKRVRLAADEGDDEDGEPMVTHAAARHEVQLLQRYFGEQGFSDSADASLDACADLIYSRAHASFKQTTLHVDSFFFFVG